MVCRPIAALVLAGALLSCQAPPPAPSPRGPIVWITASGLRADVIGPESREPAWAPRINEFATRDEDGASVWSGTVVIASSRTSASLTSLLTGVPPWQHQVLASGGRTRPGFPLISELLAEAGRPSRAYIPVVFHELLGAGFTRILAPLSAKQTGRAVRDLTDGELLFIHLTDTDIARRRRSGRGEAQGLLRHHLLAYADPEKALPEEKRQRLWEAYGRGVRRLDKKVGLIFDQLREHPMWHRTTVVLTSSQGFELGEHGGILYGENLGRAAIEVPLLLRLPASLGSLAEPAGSRVGQTRIWTTLAEIAGLEVAPLYAPSLFRVSSAPILSELYGANGVNRFSLVRGDLQLHWAARFSPPEPEYYTALQVRAGARPRILKEPARRIFARLEESFRHTLPLSGKANRMPELRLERWTPDGTEELEDPTRAREAATELRRRWSRFLDRERTPAEEEGQPRGEGSPAQPPST